MRDEDFLRGAVELLSDETRAAASACASAQSVTGRRLTPREVIDIANALGAPHFPVLALMGWVPSSEYRPNRHAYFDVFDPLPREFFNPSREREAMAALAICRTIMN